MRSRPHLLFREATLSFARKSVKTESREVPLIVNERRNAYLALSEPAGNRTLNPQLKRLLLCQLSYRPESCKFLITARQKNWREFCITPRNLLALSFCVGSLPQLFTHCQAFFGIQIMLIGTKLQIALKTARQATAPPLLKIFGLFR